MTLLICLLSCVILQKSNTPFPNLFTWAVSVILKFYYVLYAINLATADKTNLRFYVIHDIPDILREQNGSRPMPWDALRYTRQNRFSFKLCTIDKYALLPKTQDRICPKKHFAPLWHIPTVAFERVVMSRFKCPFKVQYKCVYLYTCTLSKI